jgi:hypothetical protein
MEGPTGRFSMIGRVGQRHRRDPGGLEEEAEQAVVGTDEVVAGGQEGERTPGAPDTGVHDREVDGAGGEEPVGGLEREGTPEHVLGRHGVGQVHQPSGGVDGQDHTLDDADVGVFDPEVGQECDDPARPGSGPPAA